MQPFDRKTVYSILLALAAYAICLYTMQQITGWLGILLRVTLFSLVMIGGVFYFRLTPDAWQLYANWKEKLKIKR